MNEEQMRQIVANAIAERDAALIDGQKLRAMVGFFAGDSVDVAAEIGHVSGDLRVGEDGAVTGDAAYRPPSDWVSPHAAPPADGAGGGAAPSATGQRSSNAGQNGTLSPGDAYIEQQKTLLESGTLGPGRDGFTGQRA